MDPINLLIWIAVGSLVVWLLLYLIDLLPTPPVGPPVKAIFKVVVILIALLYLLNMLVGGHGYPFWHR